MKNIKELQLDALDSLGKQLAEIDHDLDRLAKLTNEFDVEAKVFVIGERARRLQAEAFALHREMHDENSKLIGTEKLPKDVFRFIFGNGKLFVAALLMLGLAGVSHAWEFERNPDRFVSVGLNYNKLGMDANGHTTLPSGAGAGSANYDVSGNAIIADLRVPVHQSLTLTLSLEKFSQEQTSNGISSAGSPAYTDKIDFDGQRVGIGLRYYLNK